jgi:hypothetical protein
MLTRRRFVQAAAGAALLPFAPRAALALPDATLKALEKSGLVYVSPLRSDGNESTCHAEIWYGWLDGMVIVASARDRWRARSVDKGLDRARIWVGDYGQWKRMLGKNETFRDAPSFDAKAAISTDKALFARLMKDFARKYPKEFPSWDERMNSEFASGKRVMVTYTPSA